jgi:hypothetical protein
MLPPFKSRSEARTEILLEPRPIFLRLDKTLQVNSKVYLIILIILNFFNRLNLYYASFSDLNLCSIY